MAERTPADIARDTLKLLAARRLAPTPENYQALYEESAGLAPRVAFPTTPLRRIATVLPRQTGSQQRIAQQFSAAVEAQDWTALQSAIADYAQLGLSHPPQPPELALQANAPAMQVVPANLAEQLARTLESTASALGEEDARMQALTLQLVSFLRTAPPPLAALEQMLGNYSYRLSFTSEDQAQRRRSMHALLRMVGEHIVSMAEQDSALQQQASALSQALLQPWTLQQLDTIQIHLKNLLFRHLEIEGSRSEAHAQLKQLLAQHSEQMLALGRLSDQHAQALQHCATQLESTHNLQDLASGMQTLVTSGQALVSENRVVQAQLLDLQEQVLTQEAAIHQLSSTLHQVQDSTRHDPATGALNFLGLQETLLSEAGRNQRHPGPLGFAVLQLDAVTALTPPPPQAAGTAEPTTLSEASMTHVARLARSTLRPQDALARIGPTGFAVLFPATSASAAAHALARLQLELSERPLRHQDELHTLSFSAGVIQAQPHHTLQDALSQATHTCEQAQRMGSARVALA